jgi:8-oxo-dGTP pyrophosphatase MutT (NUDIX family)
MELDHIQQILGRYLAAFPAEHARTLPLAEALADDTSGSALSRHSAAHITTGAVVVNLQRRTVLQVRHRRLNQWLLPGGHVECSDRSLPEAAHRELAEEIGEAGRRASLTVDYPLDIDVHVIPAQPDRRELEHVHFDFRFVFTMSTGDIELATDEIEGFRWTSLPALGVLGQRVGDVLDHG